jgi:creatinine amidohydrolase
MTELATLTWPQMAERSGDGGQVLAVPVGATEQHGPHLPLSTDTDIAVALAGRLTHEVPGVVVAPPLAFGSSGEHQGFPGTLSIGQHAVELLIVELVRSACLTFPQIVLVSAHGGNSQPLALAVRRLRYEGRDVRAWSPRWPWDAHAGRTETSLMLALAPHRVHLERAEPGNTTPIGELLPQLRQGGLRAATANGVLGDPTGANAEEGERLLRQAANELITYVRRMKENA